MDYLTESEAIENWVDLVRSRRDVIGNTKEAETGEEFTTCGEMDLDNRVASILLNTVQDRLPNYGVCLDGEIRMGRTASTVSARKLQLLPSFLFSVDWAATAPGVSWPEAYYVTYVPSINLRIVTASRDDTTIWGCTDLAIGMCRAVRTPDFGTKKIIQSWWRRACGCEPIPWETFWSAGLIDRNRAEKWKKEVYGSSREDWWQ